MKIKEKKALLDLASHICWAVAVGQHDIIGVLDTVSHDVFALRHGLIKGQQLWTRGSYEKMVIAGVSLGHDDLVRR